MGLILDKARADADHARLSRLHRAFKRNQQTLRHTLADATDQADNYAQRANAVADAIARSREIRGDAFHMTVDSHAASTRAHAGRASRALGEHQPARSHHPAAAARTARGLDLDARVQYDPTTGSGHSQSPSVTCPPPSRSCH